MVKQFSGIYRNKSVLITGVTGFKGSWLALWLNSLGAKITGYSLKPPTNPSHFRLLGLKPSIAYADIRNLEKLTAVIKRCKPEIVFHLAAQSLVRRSFENPKETFETNVMGTLNLFEACRRSLSVRAIINVTSDKCYENKERPISYKESDAMGGYDPYSASKGCAELLTASYRKSFLNIQDFNSKHNTLIASCRAGNVIGGGDWARDRLIPDIMRGVSNNVATEIRSPYAVRPWQHVLEPLSGYLLLGQVLLEGKKDFAQAWNFGPDDSRDQDVKHVIDTLHKQWNKIKFKHKHNQTDMHEAGLLKLDSTKARQKLNWKPVWDFDTTIKKTADWYKYYYEEKKILSGKQLDEYAEDARGKKLVWSN